MRPLLMLPLLLVVTTACSQNPHVDVSSQPQKVSAAATETASPKVDVADRDHDGVPDSADQCPDEPGPVENNGCPYPKWQDHDGDGVPDAEDRCPTEPGPAENHGCPWPDTAEPDRDHDGVPDKYDRCPDVPGQIYNDGCPLEDETDRDGTPDRVGNRRFPKEEERRVLLEVKESLKFNFDKEIIRRSSFPALQHLAQFMEKYPGSRLKMVGHTDDVGTLEYNQELSQDRVESVTAYLVSQGISLARINASARGKTEPLVNTEGLEGDELEAARAENRRVDMSIRYVMPSRVR